MTHGSRIPVRAVLEIIDDVVARGVNDPDEAKAEIKRFVDELRRRVLLAGGRMGYGEATTRLGDLLAEREKTRDSIGCVCREVGAEACPIHKHRKETHPTKD